MYRRNCLCTQFACSWFQCVSRARLKCHFDFIKFDDWQMRQKAAATNKTNDLILWQRQTTQHLKSCSLVVALASAPTMHNVKHWDEGKYAMNDLERLSRCIEPTCRSFDLDAFSTAFSQRKECTTRALFSVYLQTICSSIEFGIATLFITFAWKVKMSGARNNVREMNEIMCAPRAGMM